jgi:hypothetical protein
MNFGLTTEDTLLVECENDHRYAIVVGEDPEEYPCLFCGSYKVTLVEE